MTLTELQNLDFRCYVTAAGFNYEATAKATSKTVNITHIQLGKGMLPADQSPVSVTQLVESYGEQGRFSASVTEDADNPGGFIAQAIIPADHAIDGQGYLINEAAAVLDNGIVYAYRRVESDFKLVGQGSAKSYILRMRFRPANAEVIHFTIDPSVVLATEQDITDAMKRHEQKADPHSQYAKKQDLQSHLNASDPHNQYAQKAEMNQFIEDMNMVGFVLWSSGKQQPSGRWVKPARVELSRTAYAELWQFAQESGTLVEESLKDQNPETYAPCYGTGDGSTTFTTPDYRGEFFRVWDDSKGIDSGRSFGTPQKGSLIGFDCGGNAVYVAATGDSNGSINDAQNDMGFDDYNPSNYPKGRLISVAAGSNVGLPGDGGNQAASGITRPRNLALVAWLRY